MPSSSWSWVTLGCFNQRTNKSHKTEHSINASDPADLHVEVSSMSKTN